MKVWLVWQGIYSDKDVVAVAETEEIANKLKEVYANDKWQDTYVTSVDMATKNTVRFEKAFRVVYDKDEGACVEDVRPVDDICDFESYDEVNDYGELEVWVKADTKEEAIKKAADLFAVYRAREAGI